MSATTVSALPRRMLVTGGTGFIGRRLVSALLEAGCDVTVLALPGDGDMPSGVRIYEGDIIDADGMQQMVAAVKPEGVVHLAAAGITNPGLPMRQACEVNVGGVIHLLDAIHAIAGVQRVVLMGTSYAYGGRRSDDGLDPFNAYSASKVAAWAFARAAYNAWRMPIVWVRPFQVYGPGQHRKALVPAAMIAALRGDDFPMTKGEQQRDFVFIDDVIRGLIAAIGAPRLEGRVVDLGTGVLYTVYDVVARIWDLADAQGQILAGALPYRPGEVSAISANVQRTRLLMGWEAMVPLDEGLKLTLNALNGCSILPAEENHEG